MGRLKRAHRLACIVGNRWGQSTIEFALMIVLLMSMVFFVLQLALIYSYGNYVHYATFMAARALLSSQADPGTQKTAATNVLDYMLGANRQRFSFIGQGVNEASPLNEVEGPDPANYQKDSSGFGIRAYSWLQGVRYTFRSPLFRVPMAGLGSSSNNGNPTVNTMTLSSESWLGRDPTDQECQDFMTNYLYSNTGNQESTDNGGC